MSFQPRSHWSFDERAARLQRVHNRPKERYWRTGNKPRVVLSDHERTLRALMREYDCTQAQAERLLHFLQA
jgi:broad specificity phosphatase PhoE